MTDTKPKRPRDTNQLAKRIVDIATGDAPDTNQDEPSEVTKRKVAGGKKGGAARAAKLTVEQREEIAKLAAAARWKKS